MNIGENLQKLRKQFNMSQSELAVELGISQSMVSQYERETKDLSLKSAYTIAKLFNIPMEKLIER